MVDTKHVDPASQGTKRKSSDGEQEHLVAPKGGLKKKFSRVFQEYPVDNLYHFGLDTETNNLQTMFQDVEVVCMMGSSDRAGAFAAKLADIFPSDEGAGKSLAKTDRCSLYKVGKVLSLSHGMGNPSCLIFLHEVAKLMFHAKADLEKIKFVRMGTSGGIGVPSGTVCFANEACDAELQMGYEHVALGRKKRWPAKSDVTLNQEIMDANKDAAHKFLLKSGVTMATDDYYEGQGRRDGALEPWYTEDEKMDFLKLAASKGVVNMEMEATCFLFFFNRLGARATIIAAALLDRLNGDQHNDGHEAIKEYSARPQLVVIEWLKKLFAA